MAVTGIPDKQRVYEILVDDILSNRLAPGDALVERTLAERFGLSRTPIREILRRLESDYLVDVYPNQGAFVRKLSPRDVRDLFQMREALEPLAAELAARHRPDDELAELRARYPDRDEWTSTDPAALTRLGEATHDAIVRWSGNGLLNDVYASLRRQTRLVRGMTRTRVDIELASLAEHIGILDAVEDRDAERARESMIAHLRRSGTVVMELLLHRSQG